MNALANSQLGELEKFLRSGHPARQGSFPTGATRARRARRSERRSSHSPPDILLTNYVMLEYILTRPFDSAVVTRRRDSASSSSTNSTRIAGARARTSRSSPVACARPATQTSSSTSVLRRHSRVPERSTSNARRSRGSPRSSSATRSNRRTSSASHSGGRPFRPRRSRVPRVVARTYRRRATRDHDAFLADPLASWVETTLGLRPNPTTSASFGQRHDQSTATRSRRTPR